MFTLDGSQPIDSEYCTCRRSTDLTLVWKHFLRLKILKLSILWGIGLGHSHERKWDKPVLEYFVAFCTWCLLKDRHTNCPNMLPICLDMHSKHARAASIYLLQTSTFALFFSDSHHPLLPCLSHIEVLGGFHAAATESEVRMMAHVQALECH